MQEYKKHPGKLLFFGNPEAEPEFIDLARRSFASLDSTARQSEAEDLVRSGSVNVVILTSILSTTRQCEILSALNALTPVRPVLLLALTDSIDRDTALQLMNCGADALIVPPSNEQLLRDVLKRAEAQRLKRITNFGSANSEQYTSLQWIVEQVADSLQAVAESCETNPELARLKPTNKAMQEILLAVFASANAADQTLLARVLSQSN